MINLKEVFEKYGDSDFLKFDEVKNKLAQRADLCAFLLLDKLQPSDRDIVGGAEHDEIWLEVDCEKLAKVATEEDILTLVRCGVMYDEDHESLEMFV